MPDVVDALVVADAESLCVAYLAPLLSGIPVSTKVRNPRPAGGFVQVLRVGGVERDPFTDSPLLVFHCWAPDDIAASGMARRVQALMKACPDSYSVSGVAVDRYVDVGGIQNNPDPATGAARYTFSLQLDIRKSIL